MTDERIFSYLLGELPEEESERFDAECFAGEDWPEQIKQIRLVERDLIDAYLSRELTPEQRQHFELNYLTNEVRLKRVATAAALLRHVDTLETEEAPTPTPVERTWINSLIAVWRGRSLALRAGLAVGVVLILMGGAWLYRTRTTSPRVIATLTLTISVDNNRAEGTAPGIVKLSPDADALRINLRLPDKSATAASYRAELINNDGKSIPLSVAGQDAEFVSVEILAARLTRGRYVLRLFAVRPEGTEQRVSGIYLFNVE
ncbi:MAG: hypothetical protein QOH49_1489 [Acidobacteriota bacterium]|jgi:hypothetical protein|nr:hypothetical protein [Acidobacteriota bacterium]